MAMTTTSTEDQSGIILERLIDAAVDDRKEFLKTGKEIAAFAYMTSSEKDDYEGFTPEGAPDVPFKARLSKMAQALDLFGPFLYPSNPTRRVISRESADQYAQARNARIEQFLNYTPLETDLYGESLCAINDALCYGRGVMWTGFDSNKQLVCSVADTVENLLEDPDARTMKQVNWKGRIRYKPRWEWMTRYRDQAEMINELDAGGDRPSDKKGKKRDHSTEMVKMVEVYARVGLHNYSEGFNLIDQEREQGMADDTPRKYVVSGKKVITSGPWEVPLHRDGDWPCTEVDFRERANRVWPNSPLLPGLCHQKALNWVYTTFINRMSKTNRKIFAVLDGGQAGSNALSLDAINQAIYGDDMAVVKIPWNGQDDVDVRKVIQEVTISSGSEEFEKFYTVIAKEFEDATGLTPLLMSGDVGYQLRIKADAEMKDRSSKTRLNYYKERVEMWQAKIARKEALTMLFLQPRDVLAEMFGDQFVAELGVVMPPKDVAMQKRMNQQREQMAAQMGMQPPPPQPVGIDFDLAMREADYEIESGSMRARSPEQAQDAAGLFLERGVPALTTAGMVGPALEGMAQWAAINQFPAEFINVFKQAAAQIQQQQAAQTQQTQDQGAQQLAAQAQQESAMQAQQHAHEMQMQQQKLMAEAAMAQQKCKHDAAQKHADRTAAATPAPAPEPAEREPAAAEPAEPVVVNLTVNNAGPAVPTKRVYRFDRQGGSLVVAADAPDGTPAP